MTAAGRIAFHTFGCKVNQYETEQLRDQMRRGGYDVVPFEDPANVYLINSCTVTADADSSCRQLVRKVLREQPQARVVVTGCYAERAPSELQSLSPRVEVFGNHEKPLIAATVGVPTACVEAAAREGVSALAERSRAFMKVQDGCDAHCTYCIIPSVRPTLMSRDPQAIIREAENLLARGFKELVLTGVRLGRYRHGSWDLSNLLEALLELPGDFRIRLSSIEMTEIADRLIDMAASHPKFCRFFHIPLQSGDDAVLKRMGRWYTSAAYRRRIGDIRRQVPDVGLSADVICGFPGETESQFQGTMDLLEQEGFSRVHAFRYSARPGTPSARLADVDPGVRAERTRRLARLDRRLRAAFASTFIGRTLRVLTEDGGEGYSEQYIRVRCQEQRPARSGEWRTVIGQRMDGEKLQAVLASERIGSYA